MARCFTHDADRDPQNQDPLRQPDCLTWPSDLAALPPLCSSFATFWRALPTGTIGGVANNGLGVAGVSWNVKMIGCKFLSSSGSGSTSDAIECVRWCREQGAKITSNSWGGGGYSQALFDEIQLSAVRHVPQRPCAM